MNVGLKITQRCNFKCDHCMFSCGEYNGNNMSNETISLISDFIHENKDEIQGVHIYGGEPFLDIKHLKHCIDSFKLPHTGIFIATNGAFLMRKERMEYVYSLLADYPGESGVSIGISCTPFHTIQYSREFEANVQKLKSCFVSERSFSILFKKVAKEIDPICMDVEGRIHNPFYNNENIHFREEQYDMKGVDMNPSGRAFKNMLYDRKEEICCFLARINSEFNDIEFDENGDIGLCCLCKSGTIGNIRDFKSLEEIKSAAYSFRDAFQKRYGHLISMYKSCHACKSKAMARRWRTK